MDFRAKMTQFTFINDMETVLLIRESDADDKVMEINVGQEAFWFDKSKANEIIKAIKDISEG